MEDRIPSPGQEGRVLITPENGEAYYAKITMADNPTNPGTALNKENLLQDSTEVELFGNSNNRTVDQAFSGIASKIALIMQDVAAMTLTVQDSAETGIPGVLIGGMLDADGDAVYTNASGVATETNHRLSAPATVSYSAPFHDVITLSSAPGAAFPQSRASARCCRTTSPLRRSGRIMLPFTAEAAATAIRPATHKQNNFFILNRLWISGAKITYNNRFLLARLVQIMKTSFSGASYSTRS